MSKKSITIFLIIVLSNCIGDKNSCTITCGPDLIENDILYQTNFQTQSHDNIISTRKILIILTDRIIAKTANAQIGGFMDIDKNEIKKVFFAPTNSVKSFFKENSYGKIIIEGKITNPLIGFDGRAKQELIDALDPSVDFSQYEYFFFITLRSGDCTGGASIGKVEQYTTEEGPINVGSASGTVKCLKEFYNPKKVPVIIHELGHAFGLMHTGMWMSKSLECPKNIPINHVSNKKCLGKYGLSVMGYKGQDLFIFHRNKLVTPFAGPSLTVTKSGKYWIRHFRDNANLSHNEELRIPTIDGYYSLEISHNITNQIRYGVVINFIPNNNEKFFNLPPVFRIDILSIAPPAFSSLNDFDSFSNFTFADPVREFSVTLLKIEKNRALLEVSIK